MTTDLYANSNARTAALSTNTSAVDPTQDEFLRECREQVRELNERKAEQEQRLEALIQSSFGQIEQVFNVLLQVAQAKHAATHTHFQEASTLLEQNLNHHQQVETKLRAIMAILLGWRFGMMSSRRKRELLQDVKAVSTTCDPHLSALLDHTFQRFDQWKTGSDVNGRSKLMRLRLTLDHLLTRLLGARDFAGAAQVLAVLYHRFTLIPARCVQASLEILRRHPQLHKDELMQFYQTALQNGRLDPTMLYKEMFMLHIVSGDYYEAYHLFKDAMQELDIHHDAHFQGMLGMVCYWLLFIESAELRDKLLQDQLDALDSDDDDEDESTDQDNGMLELPMRHQERMANASTAAEWVESRYMYKAAIGVHILYQEATSALRRAIAVTPDSAVFLEFYVQLLTLVGETTRACDALEHFYHSDPTDPHAARLVARYLSAHFPESTDAQVEIYIRWLETDPSSVEALDRLMEISSAGYISSSHLVLPLAKAIDNLGGDIYLSRYPKAASRLWRSFMKIVCAVRDEATNEVEGPASMALADLRSSRRWWIRTYFSRPASLKEMRAFLSGQPDLGEVVVLKAVIAHLLYDVEATTITRAVDALLQTSPSLLTHQDVETFQREFPSEQSSRLFQSLSTTLDLSPDRRIGSQAASISAVSVLNRSLLVKDTKHAARPIVQVTHSNGEEQIVNQELVAALEEAVRVELADGQMKHRVGKRSFEAMISGLLSSTGDDSVSVPLYVDLLEELLYKRTKAWSPHLQVQLNNYLRDARATIPTWLEVNEAFRYFQERWISNEAHYGHPGLLLRYEVFLVRFLRKRAKNSQFWGASVSPGDVNDALREMRLHVSRSHVHFPVFEEAAQWMRIKASRFLRSRRRLLRDYMLAMRFVAYESDHVETRDLVYAAMRVAAQNYHSDLLTVEDLQRQATIVLMNRYAHVVRLMWPAYREFFEAYVRLGRTYDPVEVLAALMRRYRRLKRMKLNDVKAFLWLKRWEAESSGGYRELIYEAQA